MYLQIQQIFNKVYTHTSLEEVRRCISNGHIWAERLWKHFPVFQCPIMLSGRELSATPKILAIVTKTGER